MLGQQRLVGGHHMLAVVQARASTSCAGDALLAADQLDHHIGVAVGQRQRIGRAACDLEAARLALDRGR